MTEYSITYGSREIKFRMELSCRKSLVIKVNPDLSVIVKAPEDQSVDNILRRVKKRASWIVKQLSYFDSLLPPVSKRQYLSGETHLYMGKQYRLKIMESPEEDVKLRGGFIYVMVKDKSDSKRVERLLHSWYLSHAKKVFWEKVSICHEKIKKYDIPLPTVMVRKMEKRWGSCTEAGNVILNTELVKAPGHCIEYVIMHELCHLKYHSHNERFFHLLSLVMPDWEKRKERLERVKI